MIMSATLDYGARHPEWFATKSTSNIRKCSEEELEAFDKLCDLMNQETLKGKKSNCKVSHSLYTLKVEEMF